MFTTPRQRKSPARSEPPLAAGFFMPCHQSFKCSHSQPETSDITVSSPHSIHKGNDIIEANIAIKWRIFFTHL